MATTSHPRAILAASLVLAAGIGSPKSTAAVMSWSYPGSGSFNIMSNWNLGQVPNHDDGSIFDQAGVHTVGFSPLAYFPANQWTYVARGTWTLDMSDKNFTLTNPGGVVHSLRVAVSNQAHLTIRNGAVSGQQAMIADGPSAEGSLTVNADCELFLQDLLTVGDDGDGDLIVFGGSARSGGLLVGDESTSESTVVLTTGASLRSTGPVHLGWDGDAILDMATGSSAQFDQWLVVGVKPGSDGHIEMTGATLTVGDTLAVGDLGEGSLTLESGSSLSAGDTTMGGLKTSRIDATSSMTIDGWLHLRYSSDVYVSGLLDVSEDTVMEGTSRLYVDGTFRTHSLDAYDALVLQEGAAFELREGDLRIGPSDPLGGDVDLVDTQVAIGGDLDVWHPDGGEGSRLDLEGGTTDVGGQLMVGGEGALIQHDDNLLTASRLVVVGYLWQISGAIGIGDLPDLGTGVSGMIVAGTTPDDAIAALAYGYLDVIDLRIATLPGSAGVVDVFTEGYLVTQGDIVLGRSDGTGTARLGLEDSCEVFTPTTVTVHPNSILEMTDAATVDAPIINHGELRGDGFVSDDVVNHGIIAPSQSESTVALAITDVLTMKPGSVYECELGGPAPAQRDSVEAHGGIVLEGGVVQMSATNGFEPQVGQLYQIMEGLVTGTFDGVEPADQYALVYGAAGVFVQVLSSGCSADLDGSQHVGFGDLAMLLGAWGPCGEGAGGDGDCPADLDGSNHVGFDDLAMLLGSWGSCS